MIPWNWLLAAVHLLGLGIGLGGVWARSRALSGVLDPAGVQRVLVADSWWGGSAILLIGTGLLRAFAGFEKGTAYYLHNHFFFTKMAFVVLILLLELAPMVALIQWRIALAKGREPDTHRARTFARISVVQAFLLVGIVLAATAMARGYGQVP